MSTIIEQRKQAQRYIGQIHRLQDMCSRLQQNSIGFEHFSDNVNTFAATGDIPLELRDEESIEPTMEGLSQILSGIKSLFGAKKKAGAAEDTNESVHKAMVEVEKGLTELRKKGNDLGRMRGFFEVSSPLLGHLVRNEDYTQKEFIDIVEKDVSAMLKLIDAVNSEAKKWEDWSFKYGKEFEQLDKDSGFGKNDSDTIIDAARELRKKAEAAKPKTDIQALARSVRLMGNSAVEVDRGTLKFPAPRGTITVTEGGDAKRAMDLIERCIEAARALWSGSRYSAIMNYAYFFEDDVQSDAVRQQVPDQMYFGEGDDFDPSVYTIEERLYRLVILLYRYIDNGLS